MTAAAATTPSEENDSIERAKRALQVLAGLVGVGLVTILLYAFQSANIQQYLSVVGGSAVIAGASLLIGGFLGFLFGIPRILRQPTPPQLAASANADTAVAIQYQPNTNLEEISDWLTKIIVGVGLTQISTLSGRLQSYANYAAPALGGFPSSGIFAISLLIYYLVCGFLIGYLWTRLYLASAFRAADELALLKKAVDALDQQVRDAKALRLVDQQLAKDSGEPKMSQDDWNEAIAGASKSVQDQVFYRVDVARPDVRSDADTSFKRTRSIPILQALVASDKESEYDKSRALLAIALIDQKSPDWNLAKRLLDEAIEIRNKRLKEGSKASRWYEYYRAICNMALDPNLAQNKPADANHRRLVADDLAAAANWTGMKDARNAEFTKENSTMRKWFDLNKDALLPVAGS